MLSRVANSIYWMQRYRERAENLARILEVNLILHSDLPEDQIHWKALLETTTSVDLFNQRYPQANQENVFSFFTFDLSNPDSLISCIQNARENARTIREIITTEMWEELNTTYLFIQKESRLEKRLADPYFFFNRIKRQCQLFTGISDTTMSHGIGWNFGRIGYLIERADMTSRLLDVKYFTLLPAGEAVGSPFDNIQWNALLKTVSGLEMYRKRWRSIYYVNVIEFLMLDAEFPRSVFSCLSRAHQSLDNIQSSTPNTIAEKSKEYLANMLLQLSQTTGTGIVEFGFHEYIDRVQTQIMQFDDMIHSAYFNRILDQNNLDEFFKKI